jgi:serine/threonine protein kinase
MSFILKSIDEYIGISFFNRFVEGANEYYGYGPDDYRRLFRGMIKTKLKPNVYQFIYGESITSSDLMLEEFKKIFDGDINDPKVLEFIVRFEYALLVSQEFKDIADLNKNRVKIYEFLLDTKGRVHHEVHRRLKGDDLPLEISWKPEWVVEKITDPRYLSYYKRTIGDISLEASIKSWDNKGTLTKSEYYVEGYHEGKFYTVTKQTSSRYWDIHGNYVPSKDVTYETQGFFVKDVPIGLFMEKSSDGDVYVGKLYQWDFHYDTVKYQTAKIGEWERLKNGKITQIESWIKAPEKLGSRYGGSIKYGKWTYYDKNDNIIKIETYDDELINLPIFVEDFRHGSLRKTTRYLGWENNRKLYLVNILFPDGQLEEEYTKSEGPGKDFLVRKHIKRDIDGDIIFEDEYDEFGKKISGRGVSIKSKKSTPHGKIGSPSMSKRSSTKSGKMSIKSEKSAVEQYESADIRPLNYYTPDKHRTNSSEYYSKDRKISSGAYGVVWQVTNKSDGKKYALKENLKTDKSIYNFKSHEKNEIDILSRMVHPNIINMVGITIDNKFGNIFVGLVMELGVNTLHNALTEKHINVATRKKWSNQIIAAIECLHQYNYIHCDLKSNNILIMGNGNTKLADFGLTIHKSDLNVDNNFFRCGIIAYRAPEYTRGAGDFKGGYSPYAGYGSPLVEKYRSVYPEQPITWKGLLSGELFSLGMVLLDIFANYELLSRFNPKEIIEYIFDKSLDTIENRAKFIKKFMRNKGEYEYDWAIVISKLTMGDPVQRFVQLEEIKIPGVDEETSCNIHLGEPIDYEVDDMILYKDVITSMYLCAQKSEYSVWQLASSLSLFRYILPRYKFNKSVWHHLGLCCLYLSLGNPINMKTKSLRILTIKYNSKIGLDINTLKEIYLDIYAYMNGIVRVLSVADLTEHGLVAVESMSYYLLEKQPDIREYVKTVESKIDLEPADVADFSKTDYLHNWPDSTLSKIFLGK